MPSNASCITWTRLILVWKTIQYTLAQIFVSLPDRILFCRFVQSKPSIFYFFPLFFPCPKPFYSQPNYHSWWCVPGCKQRQGIGRVLPPLPCVESLFITVFFYHSVLYSWLSLKRTVREVQESRSMQRRQYYHHDQHMHSCHDILLTVTKKGARAADLSSAREVYFLCPSESGVLSRKGYSISHKPQNSKFWSEESTLRAQSFSRSRTSERRIRRRENSLPRMRPEVLSRFASSPHARLWATKPLGSRVETVHFSQTRSHGFETILQFV